MDSSSIFSFLWLVVWFCFMCVLSCSNRVWGQRLLSLCLSAIVSLISFGKFKFSFYKFTFPCCYIDQFSAAKHFTFQLTNWLTCDTKIYFIFQKKTKIVPSLCLFLRRGFRSFVIIFLLFVGRMEEFSVVAFINF